MPKHDSAKARQRNAIDQLNLRPIVAELIDEGTFTREEAFIVEREYRRFLQLRVLYPGKLIVPTNEVDKFWHTHILDTEKYRKDCGLVFETYQDHDPHLKNGTPEHERGVKNREELYRLAFGEPPLRIRECADTSDPDCG